MSHALPAPMHSLDAKRIAATAFAIALHVIALMLMLAPMEWTPPAANVSAPPIETVIEEKKIPPIPPLPPVDVPRRMVEPVRQAPPLAIQEEPPVVSDQPDPMAIPYVPVEPQIATTFNPPPSGPVALTVLTGPAPPYPEAMIRRNVTGRVVLRIEVDFTGHPVSGGIESSSGSTILDKLALKFVLAKWRFMPAQHAGQPIAATCLVPIVFSLD
ncbi:MAG: energy transducer TonB [Alphaproteobacteria bacterium]